ncbi:MAG TPA: DUF5302 domain-containing protein [Nocardioidaceae bacterium]|nr:DUF5302 domain-containing protein [Nocardioidaceae bacterium]
MADQSTPHDDIKAKFREALDKKKEHQHASAERAEHDGSDKSHGTADRTETPMFRRKSAGGGA